MAYLKVFSDSVGKSSSSRDLVINVLASEWPLSIKEIYSKLVKEYAFSASYQALHKTIVALEKENIVAKSGRNYSLNRNWITNLKRFAEELNKKYSNTSGKYEIAPAFSGTIKMHFNDISTFAVTIAEIYASKVLVGSGPDQLCGILRHGWWPFRFSFSDFDILKRMCNNLNNASCIIIENTPFDRWIANHYVKSGFKKVLINPKIPYYGLDIGVFGDCIIKTCFSKETNEILDKTYSRNTSIADLFKEYTIQMFAKQKHSIDVIITRDPLLANIIRDQIMNHINNDKEAIKSYFKEVKK